MYSKEQMLLQQAHFVHLIYRSLEQHIVMVVMAGVIENDMQVCLSLVPLSHYQNSHGTSTLIRIPNSLLFLNTWCSLGQLWKVDLCASKVVPAYSSPICAAIGAILSPWQGLKNPDIRDTFKT